MHNGTTLSELEKSVEGLVHPNAKYEVRVQIVANGGVILHTFPSEQIVLSESRKCGNYDEAVAVYEDARKQLGI